MEPLTSTILHWKNPINKQVIDWWDHFLIFWTKQQQQQPILNIFIWCLESHEGLLEPSRANTHGLDKPIRQEWTMSCGNDETSTYLSWLPSTMDELMNKICRPCYKWHRSSMKEVLLRWVPMSVYGFSPMATPKRTTRVHTYILRALDLGTRILVSRLMHVRGRPHNTMMRFAWGFVPGLCHETPPKGIGQL